MTKLTDQNFEKTIKNLKKLILVDFWAPWCGPCRVMTPILEELAKEFEDKIEIAKLNVDENPSSATKYNITSIPTLIIFKNGKPREEFAGIQSKDFLAKKINSLS